VIRALYAAFTDSVKIELIVRGTRALWSCLSENIHVRSIIGRFLEHSRIYYFCSNLQHAVYLISADWMNRNLFRRIDITFQIHNKNLKKRVINEGLRPYLKDNAIPCILGSDDNYHKAKLY